MHRKDNHIFIRVNALPGEQYLLHFLILGILLSIAGYTYFVSLSIFNVIAHKEAIAASEKLQSEVSLLEQDYFELTKSITPAIAANHGMTQTADTTFVRKPGAVGSTQGTRGL
jgi:hypothetical protein